MYLKNLSDSIKIRVSSVMMHKLNTLAVIRNKSVSELIRDIILQYLALEEVKENEYTKPDINN